MTRALTCTEVLERLSDYLDGDLAAEARAEVDAHLQGCAACTRFGGEVGALVTAVRERLGASDEVPDGVAERLTRALREAGG
jgi:anti-sigma factor RsiW